MRERLEDLPDILQQIGQVRCLKACTQVGLTGAFLTLQLPLFKGVCRQTNDTHGQIPVYPVGS